MAELYVPINTSDVWKVIPQGEDIIYSTLAKVEIVTMGGKLSHKYETHLLITSNGIAFKKINFTKGIQLSDGTSENIYALWENAQGLIFIKTLGAVFKVHGCGIRLIQLEGTETKKQFIARSKLFVAKYRPLMIEKYEEVLEELLKDPIKNRKLIKGRQYLLRFLKKKEEKRLRKKTK